jgi:hypothetical protein
VVAKTARQGDVILFRLTVECWQWKWEDRDQRVTAAVNGERLKKGSGEGIGDEKEIP